MTRRVIAVPFAILMLALTAHGEQAPAPQKAAASKPELTVDAVLAMAEAGLSDDLIVAKLRQGDKPFDLTTDDLIRLKKAKVSDAVLKTMLDPKAETKNVAPTQVLVQSPLGVAIGNTRSSGATPAPGTEAAGDPNDPATPHDSGIYVLNKDRAGKPEMVVLERASYQGTKTGGVFAAALTYGIKKAKQKAVIPGPAAPVKLTNAAAVFYFYFDDKQAGLGKTMFGVGSLSNPNQFALLKLDVNKGNRETVIGEFGAFGGSSGTDQKAMIPFKSERVRPGLYKVMVDGLKSGQYCFLASGPSLGAMGAGAGTAADIFDFGVVVE